MILLYSQKTQNDFDTKTIKNPDELSSSEFLVIQSLTLMSLGFHDIFFSINCDNCTYMAKAIRRTKMIVNITVAFLVVILRTYKTVSCRKSKVPSGKQKSLCSSIAHHSIGCVGVIIIDVLFYCFNFSITDILSVHAFCSTSLIHCLSFTAFLFMVVTDTWQVRSSVFL